jgi:protein-S-isoprenylcysteine O-methyltransferase Ste14
LRIIPPFAFGRAFLIHGWLMIGYAIIMLAFFDIKSQQEEEWSNVKFPGRGEHQKRVRKMIPVMY